MISWMSQRWRRGNLSSKKKAQTLERFSEIVLRFMHPSRGAHDWNTTLMERCRARFHLTHGVSHRCSIIFFQTQSNLQSPAGASRQTFLCVARAFQSKASTARLCTGLPTARVSLRPCIASSRYLTAGARWREKISRVCLTNSGNLKPRRRARRKARASASRLCAASWKSTAGESAPPQTRKARVFYSVSPQSLINLRRFNLGTAIELNRKGQNSSRVPDGQKIVSDTACSIAVFCPP